MAELTVVVPSRGRPGNIDRLYRACLGTCTANTKLVVAVDDDDTERHGYLDVWMENRQGFELVFGPRLRLVGTLNAVAADVESPYIGFMGDDHLPRTQGWDTAYLDALKTTGPGGIVYGNDLIQGATMPTQVALDARIVRALGWMAPPCLTHLCADLFWRDLGNALGTLRYLPDVVVEHLHPIAGNAEWDPVYTDCNSDERSSADHAAFADYMANTFHADVQRVREAL